MLGDWGRQEGYGKRLHPTQNVRQEQQVTESKGGRSSKEQQCSVSHQRLPSGKQAGARNNGVPSPSPPQPKGEDVAAESQRPDRRGSQELRHRCSITVSILRDCCYERVS